jgi:hypothetical protein
MRSDILPPARLTKIPIAARPAKNKPIASAPACTTSARYKLAVVLMIESETPYAPSAPASAVPRLEGFLGWAHRQPSVAG